MRGSWAGRRALAWPVLQAQLAETFSAMEEAEFLVLQCKDNDRYVQFAASEVDGLRGEVGSNAFLTGDDRLSARDLATLRALGWVDPTAGPDDEDGSPNHVMHWPAPVEQVDAAALVVRTLTEALGVRDPGRLEYIAFESAGDPFVMDTLGIDRGTQ